jgi:hypothetical protein
MDRTDTMGKGQIFVLAVATIPMAAVGIAGAWATYHNLNGVLHNAASSMGLVAAGEGATFICALVALSLTLMGQHTPTVVRSALWLLPMLAAGVGVVLAPDTNHVVIMGVTPMAMTAAGEGAALVARRVVAYRTGVDLEQMRRTGLLVWHANRAQNGNSLARLVSRLAVWRITKAVASTDASLVAQVRDTAVFRIHESADVNLSAILGGTARGPKELSARAAESLASLPPAPVATPTAEAVTEPLTASDDEPEDDGYSFITDVLGEAADNIESDPDPILLTASEAAAQKGVSVNTIRSWKSRGQLVEHSKDANGRSLFTAFAVSAAPTKDS